MMPDAPQLTVQAISVALRRITANVSILTAKLGNGKKYFWKVWSSRPLILSNN